VKIELVRNGKIETVEVTPQLITPHTIGAEMELLDYPTPFQQFINTFEMSRKSLVGILVGVGNKLGLTDQTSSLKPSHMSGPLGMGMIIFTSTRQALLRHTSFTTVLYFIVIISFALAIFNLFPLPVLDGGHILFGLIEIVFGRPLPTVIIKGLSMVFVVLLIGLMVFVTLSDGNRLARSSGIADKFSDWFSDESGSAGTPIPAETANGHDQAK
jgi:membrane-associated protease RseP (regulator of RpoE activity)